MNLNNEDKVPFQDMTEDQQNGLFQLLVKQKPLQIFDGVCWIERSIPRSSLLQFRLDNILRQKPTYPSVDWTPIHKDYQWLAKYSNGNGLFFTTEPSMDHSIERWVYFGGGKDCRADLLSSYKPGSCNWRESLVRRPKDE